MKSAAGCAIGAIAIVFASGCRSSPAPDALFAEAETLRARYEATATRAAIESYRKAGATWQGRDKRAAARANQGVGRSFEQLGSLQESLQAYQDGLTNAIDAGDLALQSELHSAIGVVQAYSADRADLLDGAEAHCRTALDLARRSGGVRQEAEGLTCVGEVLYSRGGNLEPSLESYRQADRLWTQIDDRRGRALATLAQGWVYSDMRRFDQARANFADARSRWTALGDTRHLAITLVSEARLLQRRGDYQEALGMFERASALLEPIGDAIWQGSSLTGQARIRFSTADVTQALTLYERALTLFEASGLKSFSIDALMSLGSALLASGDDAGALARFERALTLADELGNARWQAWAHTNIGSVHLFRRVAAPAREHLQRALQILLPLNENRLHALVLSDLGEAEQLLNHPEEALGYIDQALAVSRAAEDREESARGLFARGVLENEQGRFDAARRSLNQSLIERGGLFGDAHPLVAETRATLAQVDFAVGSLAPALAGAVSAETTSRAHLRDTLRYLPERQALNFAGRRPHALDLAISIATAGASIHTAPVFDAVIQSRGLVLDEFAARTRSIDTSDPQVAALATKVAQARQRFANLLVRTVEESVSRPLLDEARHLKEEAERALAERSAAARAELTRSSAGFEAVRAALPPGSVLVSFVQYARSVRPAVGARPPTPVPSFAAFVLRADEREASVVPLGSAMEIEHLIGEWRDQVAAPGLPANASAPQRDRVQRESGTRLRQAIWDPIAGHVRRAARVFIVPDGALSLVPFAALPVGETSYLLEEAPPIHYFSAERDLVSATGRSPVRAQGLLALGGPAFDAQRLSPVGAKSAPSGAATSTGAEALRAATTECGNFASLRFQPLDGTLAEVQELSKLWGAAATPGLDGSEALVDRDATESTFKRDAHRYRVLHLATHGFFLGGGCAAAKPDSRGVGGLSGPARTAVDNPLLLSGLALAGANRRASAGPDEDDGILTAEEVASLNLEGVEWAVLSACDTGVGEIKAGEGVFGLRRAFQVAGARTVIMSLWAVDDQATRAWMRALYEGRFQRQLSTADAVHAAALSVLRARRASGLSGSPFYWAAFVAVGDWR